MGIRQRVNEINNKIAGASLAARPLVEEMF